MDTFSECEEALGVTELQMWAKQMNHEYPKEQAILMSNQRL